MEAISTTIDLRFRVRVSDAAGSIARVVMLYRRLIDDAWSKAELTYNPNDNWAEVRLQHIFAPIEYFAQAVDETGNVASCRWIMAYPLRQVRFGGLRVPAGGKALSLSSGYCAEEPVARSSACRWLPLQSCSTGMPQRLNHSSRASATVNNDPVMIIGRPVCQRYIHSGCHIRGADRFLAPIGHL